MNFQNAKLPNRFAQLGSIVLLIGYLLLVVDCDTFMPRHNWNESWGPLVPHDTFPGDCSICHKSSGWSQLKEDFSFDHEKETGYALEGAHVHAACLRCHNDRGPVSEFVIHGCGGCHLDEHQGNLGPQCERCHDQNSWNPVGVISDHARTRFPLSGIHAVTPCESCHPRAPAGEYRGAPTRCEACHTKDFQQATPNHEAQGWVHNCTRCHNTSGWGGAYLSHDFFPLVQGHGGLNCNQCHLGNNFSGLSPACDPCHHDDYVSAPNHVASSYPLNCESCHTISAWKPATFFHQPPIPPCNNCHNSDYVSAPNHQSLGYSLLCQNCHTTNAWRPSTYTHRFPLTGDHNLSCTSCHQSGNAAQFTCINCHEHRRSEADDEHSDVNGYIYSSQACYNCHPNGRS